MKLARIALVVPVVALVAACGATTPSETAAMPDVAANEPFAEGIPVPDTPPGVGADSGATDDSAAGSRTEAQATKGVQAGPASTPVAVTSVISKGQVSLESDDLDGARFELQKLLDSWDGAITNEQSTADDQGRTARQRLEIRVPSATFGTAMEGISDLGKLIERSRTSQDVSTQVIDNNARVRSQKLSLARVQALLAQAKDLNQIIAIEAQLSRRQAELDSLEQQQKYLADQTAQATINLYLTTPRTTAEQIDEDGFAAGLRAGWDNLTKATTAVLQGIGATLPFAAVLAILAFPVWMVWQRRRALT